MAVLGFPPPDCNFFCDNIWKAAQEIHLCRFYLLGRSYGDAAWRECPHGAVGGNEPDLTFEQPDHRSEPPSAGRLTLSVSRYINPCVPRSPSAIVFSVKFRPPAPRPH